MQEINLAPVIQFRDTPPQPTAPLPIHGTAPALRPYVPDSIPVPPPPTTPQPTYAQLAEQQRQALMRDKDFVAKYQSGDVAAARKFEVLHRIILAKGVPDEALTTLAFRAGLEKPLPVPEAPAVDPLERQGAVASDYKVSAPISPEDGERAKGFAATLRLLPTLGSAVIERIASVEPKVSAMSLSEYETWLNVQEQQLGSPEEARALRNDARRAVAELGAGHRWAKIDAAALQDAWLIRTLANHWRSHAQTKGIK
jgi:hypothetical protein